ncbi:MAG: AI-2E family transporter [Syntrophomonadaceae bacterium]|nr:AI-2E family transporter [Syntrophomonadaceae bacterium]
MDQPMNIKRYFWLGAALVLLFCLFNNLSSVWAVVRQALHILSPIFTGITIAYLLNLLMTPYEKILFPSKHSLRAHRLRRTLSILMCFLTVGLALFLLVNFLLPQLKESTSVLWNNIPGYLASLSQWLSELALRYEFVEGIAQRFEENWVSLATDAANTLKNAFPQIVNRTMVFTGAIINFGLGVVLATYLLANKERYIETLKRTNFAYFKRERADRLLFVFRKANETFGNFISGQLIEAVILGTLCTIGMAILQMPYPLLIGVMIGVTGIIPILGAYLGAIPATLIILMIDPLQALWFLVFLIILQSIEGNLIYPRVVGKSIGLDGFWVLSALLVGGSIGGIGGMLIGIPLFAAFYDIMEIVTEHRLKVRGIKELEPLEAVPLAPQSELPPEEPAEETEEEQTV